MAYRARFAQAGHVTDTPGPSGVPGSRTPVQPPGVRTGAFTRPVHAHMHMHRRASTCTYMYMYVCACICVTRPPPLLGRTAHGRWARQARRRSASARLAQRRVYVGRVGGASAVVPAADTDAAHLPQSPTLTLHQILLFGAVEAVTSEMLAALGATLKVASRPSRKADAAATDSATAPGPASDPEVFD